MKKWILLAFMMISTPGFSQNLGDNCPDLTVAGIQSKDELSKFLRSLKTAAAAKDVNSISKIVHYPMQVYSKTKRKPIKSEAMLQKEFSSVFTDKILGAIESQNLEDLFCRDQGVMIGNGELRIKEKRGKIGIATINL